MTRKQGKLTQWFEELPEPYRTQALINLENQAEFKMAEVEMPEASMAIHYGLY